MTIEDDIKAIDAVMTGGGEVSERYCAWIADWLGKNNPLNKCAEATTAMQVAFPELVRVRGHVMLTIGIERPHWWLTAPDGLLIDPTVSQFTDRDGYYGGCGIYDYLPWTEGAPEPKGKCMECGAVSFYESHACSEDCDIALRAAYP